ncbi:protein sly1 [Apis mellifera caucasica]|uniref:Protein sly1 homolog n=1 Tax=Apis mellifera TaxID=7460 RepID=A0A7M7H2G3_APIME|nr:protein sly1 homolog [Apis mellifera]KAG6803306.1 protein sly1 [Apis mellifera caucasica]KAG9435270.1 protein sly1 [Apis mellifera carnica]|eukprot:XP_006569146.1 protein sly1 homolog [Apis mellifera]
MTSLRDRQINALKLMLNLNQSEQKLEEAIPVWKVLIYDRLGQDIISPLISVKELRELGITLHMQLHSDRDSIPEVPAIYFCAPTDENLVRIGQDLQNGLYDIYHLNFISPITRQKMEDLAAAALLGGVVSNIHKVFDQYLNFISLEDDLFILRHQNSDIISYHAINRGEVKDTEMESVMEIIVDCLFSVFVTLGTVPVIRCPRGNAAEMVAKMIDKKLRENVWDTRNNLFESETTGHYSFQRPLLIILDRNIDMATPLHHTWTYQALAHDVLEMALNRLVVEENVGRSPAGGTRSKTRAYELDNKDRFWCQHKGSPFPRVAEAIQEELEQYRTFEDDVKKLKSSMGIDNDSEVALSMVSNNTARLTNAVNNLPQLLEMKRLIDMHTSIATGILNFIKSRRLDTFFELEEKIMSKQTLDRSVIETISDPDCGTPEDKLRLAIIYYICTNMSDNDYSKLESALSTAGCDLNPLIYIKRLRSYTRIAEIQNNYEGGGTKTVSMFSKLMNQGSSFVMEGVKNLVVKKHNLPVTKIVDELMESKQSSQTDDYCYLDPKQLKHTEQMPKNRPTFQDVIVFIVGGGNYIEYQNLVDYVKQKSGTGVNKRITYGSTTFINAKQLLKQLSLLGQEVHS